jgi:hypothetical protein
VSQGGAGAGGALAMPDLFEPAQADLKALGDFFLRLLTGLAGGDDAVA